MSAVMAQNDVDTCVVMMLNRAFALAIHHLNGEQQHLAQMLHISALDHYMNSFIIQSSIGAYIRSSTDDITTSTAAAITMLLHAITTSPTRIGGPANYPPGSPALACIAVMLADARTQAAYQNTTGLPSPNTSAFGNVMPTPFYTVPFTAGGRYLVGPDTTTDTATAATFDQAPRLSNTLFWHRASARALPFPYASPPASDDFWSTPGTTAALNISWGYWLARLGYADPAEHLGPWGAEERAYVAALMARERDVHDVDVVAALNADMAGRESTVTWQGVRVVVGFRPRGVFGLRRLIRQQRVAVWRVEAWEREWVEDDRVRREREEEERREGEMRRRVLPEWLW
ncbi:hypothetical protein UCDDS831_g04189 [Diplodia seriata]|uniref:Uncharacterized protein n=1 Tax=Diplodia seriata TaxID=420778 RepID=A0A0G2EGV7_9PEZI|nr:hypothetical protein UCDDS831_g04189 [Diplodia seriata]